MQRRSQIDPDAVASSVFTIVWQKYDEALSKGLPWLYRTAQLELRNQTRSESRRQERETRHQLDVRFTLDGGPELAQAVTRNVWIRELMSQLSPADQEVLMLLYWEDLDTKSAAGAAGCSAATFAVRAHRARKGFSRLLDVHPSEEQSRGSATQQRVTSSQLPAPEELRS